MSAGRDVITATGNYAPTIINLPAETSSVDLDTALAILDAMPTVDSVPRAVYRVGSSLQRGANPHFVGREAELRQLAQLLKAEGGGAAIGQAAVTGLGGIGKTQLAAEFVHRYGRFFAGGVFWLNLANLSLDDIQEAERQLSEWGEAVGRPDFLALDAPTRLQLVKHALHAPIPRLLVFDNLDHRNAPRMLQQLRPKTGGCRVLITSRRGTWASSTGVQQLTLATLPQAESRQLLLKLAPHLTAAEADRVAERLGYFPLALYLAGSFLNTYKHPTNQFLARYERQKLNHRAMQGQWLEDYSVTEHDLSVYGTFSVSWEQLDTAHPIDQLAIWVMQHAACFAPSESISTTLLTATLEQREGWPPIDADAANVADRIINVLRRLVQLGWPPIDAGAADVADRIVDALRRLMQLGLLDTEQGLHRLMGEFVGVDVIAQAAVEKGASSEAFRLNTAGYPAALRAWRGHLFYITEAALQRADEHSATLATNLGYHIQADGDYAGARPYYERSLSIREKSLGADHPDTALSLNNLGGLLSSMGDYAGARPYYERSLAIREKSLGADHPDTALSLNNLGMLIQSMGDYAGARPYFERSLAIYEIALGADHPDTARSLNNLGFLLSSMGNYAGARPYYERSLAIREKSLGADHPDTARSLNNLGMLIKSMGDYAGARPYFERSLSIYEKSLGADHPNTKVVSGNLKHLLNELKL